MIKFVLTYLSEFIHSEKKCELEAVKKSCHNFFAFEISLRYFVSKIVPLKNCEITRKIYSSSERSEQFLKQNVEGK